MKGQCYPHSFQLIREWKQQADAMGETDECFNAKIALVHGDVIISGKVEDHAWVEKNGEVYDFSVDPELVCSVEEYYQNYRVKVRRRYNYSEAMSLHDRVAKLVSPYPQGAPGPWDSEARIRRNLLPLPEI
jgi:hypothetical protein